ncbi:hypothetical protein [Phaeovulum sp.]|uniref:hypothetical protein n=1 Tax=Phaeovulum sp. TaxID=2934796 RepID=UPI002ABA6148|nr:hypothetical protein [Phaeovulum sp.]MDZ4119252.1 hypothetical protein [Phaeovulum sp.]
MASPADLADFLLGFALTEGPIASAAELTATEIVPQPRGIEARAWLVPGAAARLAARRRAMAIRPSVSANPSRKSARSAGEAIMTACVAPS